MRALSLLRTICCTFLPAALILGSDLGCDGRPTPRPGVAPSLPALARLRLYHHPRREVLGSGHDRPAEPEERLRDELEAYFRSVAGGRPLELAVKYNRHLVYRQVEIAGPLRDGRDRFRPEVCDSFTLVLAADESLMAHVLNEFIVAAEKHPAVAGVALD